MNGNGKQSENEFEKLKEEALTLASETDFLQLLTEKFPEGVVFSTSFSYEDQVITHLVKNLNVDIFTLDTGRLFEQTYETWASTKAFFKKEIKAYYPDTEELKNLFQKTAPIHFINP